MHSALPEKKKTAFNSFKIDWACEISINWILNVLIYKKQGFLTLVRKAAQGHLGTPLDFVDEQ